MGLHQEVDATRKKKLIKKLVNLNVNGNLELIN